MDYRINKINKILLVVGVFVILSAPYIFFMIYHLHYYIDNGLLVVIILSTVLEVVTGILFISTSVSDPGNIQKITHPFNTYDHISDKYRATNPLRLINVTVNGQLLKVKYCVTCHIYRPPRTVHCSDCDVCVLRYDHHCPYVSNCVGYYNYKLFICFVLICSLYYGGLLSIYVHRIIGYSSEFQKNVERSPVHVIGTIVNIIIIFILLWLILGLCCFHMCIVCKNFSTYDKMKENYVDFNPFNRGLLKNCKSILCYIPQKQKKSKSFNIYQPYATFSFSLIDNMARLSNKHESTNNNLNTIKCV